jgi:release factor glutamine methyltransferase
LESQKKLKKLEHNYVIDISPLALEVSQINLTKYNLQHIFTQIESDLLEKVLQNRQLTFSKNIIITANLPYIKDNDFQNMDQSVYIHEPNLALYG